MNALGQTVTYSLVVTNTGNVALTDVSVSDTQTSPAGALTSGPTCPQSTLAAGASETCTATYTVTQADIDNGSINDSATATGMPPTGPAVGSVPSPATVAVTQSPALTVKKTSNLSMITTVGQVVTFTFAVTNTGNVTLNNVTVNDVENASSGLLSSPLTCPGATATTGPSLAPGYSISCSATYTVTQADLARGYIGDTATATGTPSGTTSSARSDPAPLTIPASTGPGGSSSSTPGGSSSTPGGDISTPGVSSPSGTSTSSGTTPYYAPAQPGSSTSSTGSSSPLAFTGVPLAQEIGAAVLVVLLGLGLTWSAGRRRRRT